MRNALYTALLLSASSIVPTPALADDSCLPKTSAVEKPQLTLQHSTNPQEQRIGDPSKSTIWGNTALSGTALAVQAQSTSIETAQIRAVTDGVARLGKDGTDLGIVAREGQLNNLDATSRRLSGIGKVAGVAGAIGAGIQAYETGKTSDVMDAVGSGVAAGAALTNKAAPGVTTATLLGSELVRVSEATNTTDRTSAVGSVLLKGSVAVIAGSLAYPAGPAAALTAADTATTVTATAVSVVNETVGTAIDSHFDNETRYILDNPPPVGPIARNPDKSVYTDSLQVSAPAPRTETKAPLLSAPRTRVLK